MTITICASLRFGEEIAKVARALEEMGHRVYIPEEVRGFDYWNRAHEEAAAIKRKYGFMKKHPSKIDKSDAILVLNYDVGKIENYIGGNTFLEMGLAYYLGKPIYLLNPVPEMPYTSEIEAMEPIILNGDLAKIGEASKANSPMG